MAVGQDHILGDQEKQDFDGDDEPNFESNLLGDHVGKIFIMISMMI